MTIRHIYEASTPISNKFELDSGYMVSTSVLEAIGAFQFAISDLLPDQPVKLMTLFSIHFSNDTEFYSEISDLIEILMIARDNYKNRNN